MPNSRGKRRLMPTDLDQTINFKAGMDSQTQGCQYEKLYRDCFPFGGRCVHSTGFTCG